ncbi:MAG: glycosyltransferase family 39 protein [Deltaproteobacteria bacterium]|nr:glycosyltransferase family 39 protein [Deltaproteobacteria bacterium]
MSRERRLWISGVVLVYFVVSVVGLFSFGLTDDDDFYIPAGVSQARWLGQLVSLSGLSRAAIDSAFTVNHEHPPFAKYVFGICHFAFHEWLGPFRAARVGTVLFSTLTAFMMMILASRHLSGRRGLWVGTSAVAMMLTLPRFFFHSHAATLDVPVTAMYLVAATFALLGERSVKYAIWVGPIFGLATATKLNAPFLLLAYVPFAVLVRWGRSGGDGESGLSLPPVPLALLSMLTLGPIVFFLVWPWMWFDTVARVAAYVGFHAKHYGIHFLYFGRIYTSDPFAPWHAPFVTAALTTPVATLVLFFAGAISGASRVIQRLRARFGTDDDARREGDFVLFVALNAITTIGVVAFAGTPIYGGEKLFMPFFPFLCLLAAYGLERAVALIPYPPGASMVVAALLSTSGLSLVIEHGEYGLSSFNGLAGGLSGATALGMERQYYDVAFLELPRLLSKEAPRNLKVHFLPNNWEYARTYRYYRDAGILRSDIRVVERPEDADWIVITHERRFARYSEDLSRYRDRKILHEAIVDGTPVWSLLDVRATARSN